MVVGKKEKSDVKYQKSADLMIRGRNFNNQDVYGDKKAPNRRDVFIDNDVRRMFPMRMLPLRSRVMWMGKIYPATLSFRTGMGGRRIPVYQFFI